MIHWIIHSDCNSVRERRERGWQAIEGGTGRRGRHGKDSLGHGGTGDSLGPIQGCGKEAGGWMREGDGRNSCNS